MLYQSLKEQYINIQCELAEYSTMKSILEHPIPPTIQQFDMKLQNRSVCFKCETHISQNILVNSEYRDQPLIQNFYCYKVNKQLVKVTKIRIGNQLVTLIDRLAFKKDITQQQGQYGTERSFQVSLPTERSISEKKSFLSLKDNKILKLYSNWIKQSKPQIKHIFEEIFKNCVSQMQLKIEMRENVQIRASLIEFKQKVREQKINKSIYHILSKWVEEIISQEVDKNQMQNIQQQMIKTV